MSAQEPNRGNGRGRPSRTDSHRGPARKRRGQTPSPAPRHIPPQGTITPRLQQAFSLASRTPRPTLAGPNPWTARFPLQPQPTNVQPSRPPQPSTSTPVIPEVPLHLRSTVQLIQPEDEPVHNEPITFRPIAPPIRLDTPRVSMAREEQLVKIQWQLEHARILARALDNPDITPKMETDNQFAPVFGNTSDQAGGIDEVPQLRDLYALLIHQGKLPMVRACFESLTPTQKDAVSRAMHWPSSRVPENNILIDLKVSVPTPESLNYYLSEEQFQFVKTRWLEAGQTRATVYFKEMQHLLRRSPHGNMIYDQLYAYFLCDLDLQDLDGLSPVFILGHIMPKTHPRYTLVNSFIHFVGSDYMDQESLEVTWDDPDRPEGDSMKTRHSKPFQEGDPRLQPRYLREQMYEPEFDKTCKFQYPEHADVICHIVHTTLWYALLRINSVPHSEWNYQRQKNGLSQVCNFAILVFQRPLMNLGEDTTTPHCCVQDWFPCSEEKAKEWGGQTTLQFLDGNILTELQPRGELRVRLRATETLDCGPVKCRAWPPNLSHYYRVSSYVVCGRIVQFTRPEVHVGVIQSVKETGESFVFDERYRCDPPEKRPPKVRSWVISTGGKAPLCHMARAYPCHFKDVNALPQMEEHKRGTPCLVRLIPGIKISRDKPRPKKPWSDEMETYQESKNIPASIQQIILQPEAAKSIQWFLTPHEDRREPPLHIPKELRAEYPYWEERDLCTRMFCDAIMAFHEEGEQAIKTAAKQREFEAPVQVRKTVPYLQLMYVVPDMKDLMVTDPKCAHMISQVRHKLSEPVSVTPIRPPLPGQPSSFRFQYKTWSSFQMRLVEMFPVFARKDMKKDPRSRLYDHVHHTPMYNPNMCHQYIPNIESTKDYIHVGTGYVIEGDPNTTQNFVIGQYMEKNNCFVRIGNRPTKKKPQFDEHDNIEKLLRRLRYRTVPAHLQPMVKVHQMGIDPSTTLARIFLKYIGHMLQREPIPETPNRPGFSVTIPQPDGKPSITTTRQQSAIIEAALEATSSDKRDIIELKGPPGVGKTTLILAIGLATIDHFGIENGSQPKFVVYLDQVSGVYHDRQTLMKAIRKGEKWRTRTWNDPRILLTAATNNAADALAEKFADLQWRYAQDMATERQTHANWFMPTKIRVVRISAPGIGRLNVDKGLRTELVDYALTKSYPPDGLANLRKEYYLAKERYERLIADIERQIQLAKPTANDRFGIPYTQNSKRRDIEEMTTAFKKMEESKKECMDYVMYKSVMPNIVVTTVAMTKGHWFHEDDKLSFSMIMIDEAGQVKEADNLHVLYRFDSLGAQVLLLIGDDKQMRPVVTNMGSGGQMLRISPIIRHASPGTILKDITTIRGNVSIRRGLKEQVVDDLERSIYIPTIKINYRTTKPNIDYTSTYFYNSELESAYTPEQAFDSGREFRLHTIIPQGIAGFPIWFIDMRGPEESAAGASKGNPLFADTIIRLVKHLLITDVIQPSDITILSFYEGERYYINKLLIDLYGPKLAAEIEVCSVDGYQGRQNKFIILDLVRCHAWDQLAKIKVAQKPLHEFKPDIPEDDPDHYIPKINHLLISIFFQRLNVGFLSDPTRVNVGTTRQEFHCFVVGNSSTLDVVPSWYCYTRWLMKNRAWMPNFMDTVERYWSLPGQYWYDEDGHLNTPEAIVELARVDGIQARILTDKEAAKDNFERWVLPDYPVPPPKREWMLTCDRYTVLTKVFGENCTNPNYVYNFIDGKVQVPDMAAFHVWRQSYPTAAPADLIQNPAEEPGMEIGEHPIGPSDPDDMDEAETPVVAYAAPVLEEIPDPEEIDADVIVVDADDIGNEQDMESEENAVYDDVEVARMKQIAPNVDCVLRYDWFGNSMTDIQERGAPYIPSENRHLGMTLKNIHDIWAKYDSKSSHVLAQHTVAFHAIIRRHYMDTNLKTKSPSDLISLAYHYRVCCKILQQRTRLWMDADYVMEMIGVLKVFQRYITQTIQPYVSHSLESCTHLTTFGRNALFLTQVDEMFRSLGATTLPSQVTLGSMRTLAFAQQQRLASVGKLCEDKRSYEYFTSAFASTVSVYLTDQTLGELMAHLLDPFLLTYGEEMKNQSRLGALRREKEPAYTSATPLTPLDENVLFMIPAISSSGTANPIDFSIAPLMGQVELVTLDGKPIALQQTQCFNPDHFIDLEARIGFTNTNSLIGSMWPEDPHSANSHALMPWPKSRYTSNFYPPNPYGNFTCFSSKSQSKQTFQQPMPNWEPSVDPTTDVFNLRYDVPALPHFPLQPESTLKADFDQRLAYYKETSHAHAQISAKAKQQWIMDNPTPYVSHMQAGFVPPIVTPETHRHYFFNPRTRRFDSPSEDVFVEAGSIITRIGHVKIEPQDPDELNTQNLPRAYDTLEDIAVLHPEHVNAVETQERRIHDRMKNSSKPTSPERRARYKLTKPKPNQMASTSTLQAVAAPVHMPISDDVRFRLRMNWSSLRHSNDFDGRIEMEPTAIHIPTRPYSAFSFTDPGEPTSEPTQP